MVMQLHLADSKNTFDASPCSDMVYHYILHFDITKLISGALKLLLYSKI